MSLLSNNLTAQRESLGLTVPAVHQELNRRGVPVAFSTVAGWFNGNRGIRNMDHLKALCDVLKTDMDSMTKGEIELSEESLEIQLVREVRHLSPSQQEMIVALARSMRSK